MEALALTGIFGIGVLAYHIRWAEGLVRYVEQETRPDGWRGYTALFAHEWVIPLLAVITTYWVASTFMGHHDGRYVWSGASLVVGWLAAAATAAFL